LSASLLLGRWGLTTFIFRHFVCLVCRNLPLLVVVGHVKGGGNGGGTRLLRSSGGRNDGTEMDFGLKPTFGDFSN
jgi:hypothetical protein